MERDLVQALVRMYAQPMIVARRAALEAEIAHRPQHEIDSALLTAFHAERRRLYLPEPPPDSQCFGVTV